MHFHDVVKLYNYTFLCACASKILNAVLNNINVNDSQSIVIYTMCKQYHDVEIINDFAMHTGMCNCKVSPHHEYA